MLYLHIGTGKAGSTSIQHLLTRSAGAIPHKQLRAFGLGNSWRLAAAAGTERSRQYWVDRRHVLSAGEYDDLGRTIWDEVEKEVGLAGPGNFVASSEYLFAQYGEDREAVERLRRNLLAIFKSVRIIIYLRNQVDWIKSLYAQRVKGATAETRDFAQFVADLDLLQVPYDFSRRIRVWSAAFGDEALVPVVFDKENFIGGTLVSDFLARIDLDGFSSQNLSADTVENRSPTYFQLALIRRCNQLPARGSFMRQICASGLFSRISPREFPAHFDQDILKLVSRGNMQLNEAYFGNWNVRLPTLFEAPQASGGQAL